MFSERKITQMAVFLLHKCGGRMSHLKLMKLLYLADREAMARFGAPISGDHIVAMPHGPVLSMTLNFMDGDVESSPGGWEEWISDKDNHEISLRNQSITRKQLDELSDAEIEVLEAVWNRFGKMSRWEIRDYTHTLPEWQDPHGSSLPIPHKNVFHALGRSEREAEELSARIESERAIDRLFAAL